ncbi:MAG TPA: zinc ribbon domain-containing protein [Pyrinomonadaceae bacterium]|nr:zinc ribbon domain-containing protein [Pyrinomonadaceae bacterium]
MEILLFLGIFVAVVTLVGHGIWVLIRTIIRAIVRVSESEPEEAKATRCPNCKAEISPLGNFCGKCGYKRATDIVVELIKDLAATERQLNRFRRAGAIDEQVYENLKFKLEAERERLNNRQGSPAGVPSPQPEAQPAAASVVTPSIDEQEAAIPPSVVSVSEVITNNVIVVDGSSDQPSRVEQVIAHETQVSARIPTWQNESTEDTPPPPPPQSEPRRRFTEVLTAFMEESNIRWGEIIGGLLIIGCSTALVVSLWSEISAIPVLKFLIFTTVTAALFGIGLYTEHRWKLPTTSRGVLTIATLLVPLNFLAIAAVSGSTLPRGPLVIASELIAPAVFLCLVYFAGRVLTPKWPHLLAAGVLGSSVGQLLIRHFATPDNSPGLMLALGAFPVICYVATAAWMLWIALEDSEIDEYETIGIFVSLGALTFAALLPFGLLLYKSGPVSLSMMYLAPLVSLAGIPLLFSGTLLWKRVTAKELIASRVAGTSIALLGTMVVFSGMILAWPNPASVIPAALLNFAVLVTIAMLLEIPFAHFLAALCFSLAYLVLSHVIRGNIPWQNFGRKVSLLDASASVASGQALVLLFVPFIVAEYLFVRRKRKSDGFWYLTAACVVGAISLLLLTGYGFNVAGDPNYLWLCYFFYGLGALYLAVQKSRKVFGWIGTFLLLLASFHAIGPWLTFDFPWQSAFLFHAAVAALAAVMAEQVAARASRPLTQPGARLGKTSAGSISGPMSKAALITSVFALVCLVQANQWETTGMQAERMFWLAGIWLVSLWLSRKRALFTVFQIAMTVAVILSIKAALQQFEWYAYLPHAFLHPIALQIQGTALVLLALIWVGLRFLSSRYQPIAAEQVASEQEGWSAAASRLLNYRFAFDRLITWLVLGGFILLVLYGVFSGVKQELTARGAATPVWDIVGFPHQYALGLGSWILLGLVVVVMLANLRQRQKQNYILGAVAALAMMTPLLAGLWETQLATASAWRWFAALFLIAASIPLWLLSKSNFSLFLLGQQTTTDNQRQAEVGRTLGRRVRGLLLFVTLVPLLALTIYPALQAIYYLPLHGPAGGIFFALGDTLSYSLPIVLVAFALIVYAVRERFPSYAFSAGLLLKLAVAMVFLLSVVAVQGLMDRIVLVRVIQLVVIVACLYSILWLSLRKRWRPLMGFHRERFVERLFKLELGIAIAGLVLILLPSSFYLVLWPNLVGIGTAAVAGIYGWLAFALALIAMAWFGKSYEKPVRVDILNGALVFLVYLVAFSFVLAGFSGWGQYHVVMLGLAVISFAMCGVRSLPQRIGAVVKFSPEWERRVSFYATLTGALVVLLALRAAPSDVLGAWWSLAALIAVCGLAALLNWQTLRQEYLFAAGVMVTTVVSIWWWIYAPESLSSDLDFLCLNIAIGCAASILWLWLQLRANRLSARLGELSTKVTETSFHHFAALAALPVMAYVLLVSFTDGVRGVASAQLAFPVGWGAAASLAALMFACLWDKRASYATTGLYLVGLIMAALALRQAQLLPTNLLWATVMVLSIYTLVGAWLWRRREVLIRFANQLKIPPRLEENATQLIWLQVCSVILIAVTVALVTYIDLTFLSGALRVSAAVAVIVLTLALVLLAPNDKPQDWLKGGFVVFVIGSVLFGWSWLVPGVTGTWLNRGVILMVEMFALVALYGLELEKIINRQPDWTKVIRECVPWLSAAGANALIFVLGTEVYYQLQFGSVLVSPLALVTTGATLIAAAVISILFAVSPKHDPLGLSETRRQSYVYIGEVLLALFFMHIRLTMPWLFGGFFERYWPIVVVAIAYAGVAVSEILRRRDILVLAHPVERTGVFLPLLPVLGFWVANSEVDYSALLFIVGGLYGLVAILRRSFVFGMLAALAGNGGLWYLWHRTVDYGFFQHPQLWLIPVAVSVLIAAYLNRDEFTEDQMIGVRYLSLTVIYVSSTADIFINGVSNSPWLPLILAGLSVAGVFGGIILRVRAFLLLGSVFLLLAITTMIYYASHNLGWTWLWWVAGIVTGAMIIFTFGIFEKKREDMLRVVEGFRDWNA